MLTQEDFVAPKMSAGTLQRSSWKAEAIRRGDLKISGPIPITEETPLTDDEGKDYGEKQLIDSEPQVAEVSLPPSNPPPPPPAQSGLHTGITHTVPDQPDGTLSMEVQEEPHHLRHKVSSNSLRGMDEKQETVPTPMAVYSPLPSIQRSSTTVDPKKKRKGSLRNVIRKMFGRKNKDNEGEAVSRHGHHRSVRLEIFSVLNMMTECKLGAHHSSRIAQGHKGESCRWTNIRYTGTRARTDQSVRAALAIPYERQRAPGNEPSARLPHLQCPTFGPQPPSSDTPKCPTVCRRSSVKRGTRRGFYPLPTNWNCFIEPPVPELHAVETEVAKRRRITRFGQGSTIN